MIMARGSQTSNRTRTLILMGSSEDTHTHIRMVMTAMTTAGAWSRRYKVEVRTSPIHIFVYYDAHTTYSSVLVLHPSPSLSPHTYCRVSYREGDRGSRVTLIGLGANVLLTSAKGAAGWYMNSAALLADAGHSLSGKHALRPAALLQAVLRYCIYLWGGILIPPALACDPGASHQS